MATKSYQEILTRARAELTADEQRLLATELAGQANRNGGAARKITDLRGLGKEIWAGVDPDEYVAQERDSWDG